jgi:hypothetical protein
MSLQSDVQDVTLNAAPQIDDCSGVPALVDRRLTLQAFHQLSGQMGGYPFVKVVVERATNRVHFLNNDRYSFHADYIAEQILKTTRDEIRSRIDEFNHQVYLSKDRKFFLGILSLHERKEGQFFALETVEIDNMDQHMLLEFNNAITAKVEQSLPVFFKPANHLQDALMTQIDPATMPRVFHHELFASADFVPLNHGEAKGRLRIFRNEEEYRAQYTSIAWYDVVVMHRVPDDIPRISGIINDGHTTPLSHTNVLASGWQIPNAISIGIINKIKDLGLDKKWVEYKVLPNHQEIVLNPLKDAPVVNERPSWNIQAIRLEEPEVQNTPILLLDELRMTDRYRYGTKAANLGELTHLLEKGSSRILGFYRVPRPPRASLMPYLREYLNASEKDDLAKAAWRFLQDTIEIPRGIAIPFALQQRFLESSPRIQQCIGKLKMALTLDAKEIDSVSIELQRLIRQTRMSDEIRDYIDEQIATHLSGVSSFVVRSSSNAEDLNDFSAAGIYESINHVTQAERIFESIREVWASLVSPRSVRLRHQVGISLDDCYMGVVVQEEVKSDMGGVMVTTNPMNPKSDFRNVYINVSNSSVDVVTGNRSPYQYLFNTVEGGGRTMSLGGAQQDLSNEKKAQLQKLAFAGRLLQSHFCQDYTFSSPADIEWAAHGDKIYILQLRPYAR